MKPVVADPQLVAYCGLYCGACKAYLRDRCPGCHENERATWCKIRTCCRTHEYASCADCGEYENPKDCKLFNNLVARLFASIFRSDRPACIRQIREIGIEGHASRMAEAGRPTIKR
ncbi:DUF3795 domain-containing protein [Candidatus Sumerlaeota bacterium]|nr:DUF3795 domain-containing protein [Candidatus Sumerlaeota bacterium]